MPKVTILSECIYPLPLPSCPICVGSETSLFFMKNSIETLNVSRAWNILIVSKPIILFIETFPREIIQQKECYTIAIIYC